MIDLSVLPVYLTAVVALLLLPGPDMLLIASSSMSYGKKVGLFASLGNATSGVILTLLAAMGVSTLIAMSPIALKVLHLLGGAYLLKMGWDCLRADVSVAPELDQKNKMASTYYQRALMSNLLNPKALVFFISLMSSLVPAGMSITGKGIALVILFGLSLFWFSSLAWMLSTQRLQRKLQQAGIYIDGLCGVVFTLVGGSILYQTINTFIG